MLSDRYQIKEIHYIALLLILNQVREFGYIIDISWIRRELSSIESSVIARDALNLLYESDLVQLNSSENDRCYDVASAKFISLSLSGFSFLINNAEEYIKMIDKRYSDLPENLITTLVPYLDVGRVPAADRYVSTKDNSENFGILLNQLEIIHNELVKDSNKNEIKIENKSAIIADISGYISQIKGGYLKLSDLTTRIRPMLHNLAEVCKDIAIVIGAVSAAGLAVNEILKKLF